MVSVCCDQLTVSIDLESTVSGILYTCLTGFVSKCNGTKAFSTDSQVGRIVSHLKAALIPVGIRPVSYTHLDVYKRQELL